MFLAAVLAWHRSIALDRRKRFNYIPEQKENHMAAKKTKKRMPKSTQNAGLGGIVLVAAGVVFPLVLTAWALGTHDAFDNVKDYSPLRDMFTALVGCGLLVLVAALVDAGLAWKSRKGLWAPSMPVRVIASIAVLVSIALVAYIFVPQIIRSGDVAPQVLLAGSDGGGGIPEYVIAFYTETPSMNTLEWGEKGEEGFGIDEEKASSQHWFRLSGLEPGKEYDYWVNGERVSSFRTVPASGEPIRFAVAGDPHFGAGNSRPDLTKKMLAEIKKPENNYSVFFLLGDEVQYGFSDAMWKEALGAFSNTSSSVPFVYAMGNHDALFGGVMLYGTYLCPPGMKDPLADCYVKRIDSGNVHFIVLDVEWELEAYTPEQKAWLEKQLAEIPGEDWIIMMSHTFYYSSGSRMDGWDWYDNNATIRELVPLFEENGVDIVLSGHKHHSEVLEKNGIIYVVAGSFGGVQNPERTYVSPTSLWYKQGQYGFVDITIENSTDAELVFRDPDFTEVFRKTVKQRN